MQFGNKICFAVGILCFMDIGFDTGFGSICLMEMIVSYRLYKNFTRLSICTAKSTERSKSLFCFSISIIDHLNSHFSFSHHTERKRSASYRGRSGRCFILWNDSETMLQPSSLCYGVPSLKRRFMKHFVSCTPAACQAHKSMKRHCVP